MTINDHQARRWTDRTELEVAHEEQQRRDEQHRQQILVQRVQDERDHQHDVDQQRYAQQREEEQAQLDRVAQQRSLGDRDQSAARHSELAMLAQFSPTVAVIGAITHQHHQPHRDSPQAGGHR